MLSGISIRGSLGAGDVVDFLGMNETLDCVNHEVSDG